MCDVSWKRWKGSKLCTQIVTSVQLRCNICHCLMNLRSHLKSTWLSRHWRGVFRTQLIIHDGNICENSWPLKAVNYFAKKFHCRYVMGTKYISFMSPRIKNLPNIQPHCKGSLLNINKVIRILLFSPSVIFLWVQVSESVGGVRLQPLRGVSSWNGLKRTDILKIDHRFTRISQNKKYGNPSFAHYKQSHQNIFFACL